MTSRREQIMLDALREIAKRDAEGSGRFAQQVLDQVQDDDPPIGQRHDLNAESLTVNKAGGGFA